MKAASARPARNSPADNGRLGIVLLIVVLQVVVILIALGGRCRRLRSRPSLRCEWIGLSDQAGELGQGIAFRPAMRVATATIVIGRKRSVLISFGHRDDASLRESRAPLDQGTAFDPQGCQPSLSGPASAGYPHNPLK